MMNFYYDPILGLKYDYLGEIFIIDISAIPVDYKIDIKRWLKYLTETGIHLYDSDSRPTITTLNNITHYIL